MTARNTLFSVLSLSLAIAGIATAQVAEEPPAVEAISASRFLDSLGSNSAIDRRGENVGKTIECVQYLGLRWLRSGIEDCPDVTPFLELHRRTGARFSWSPGSGGSDLPRLLSTARELAAEDALLAFEGPNEPNNWTITYQGEKGGGQGSWLPVARYQNDMYKAVKSDAVLARYPVWGISESGAQVDNVGLQFLEIPEGTQTLMPSGTRFADAANCHNYIYHPNSPGLMDNRTWNAADPTSACKVDGLFGNHGVTWLKKFPGYSEQDLLTLPRVTTETGTTIHGPVTEEIHGKNLVTMYLDQFKRGWSHTAVYLLRDRVDEAGNQQFGFYRPDYTPRKAAVYLHNLTTILATDKDASPLKSLRYTIVEQPETVHELLLQKGDGTLDLVVWNERVEGSDKVTIRFAVPLPAVRVYDVTIGASPTDAHSNVQSLTLELSDHPVVLEIPAQ